MTPTFGRYHLLALIGSGGAAEVYAASGPDGPLALKICRSNEPKARQRFRQEIAALHQLRHPGLVNIVDSGEDEEPPWYAMEDLGRVSLRALLSSVHDAEQRDLVSLIHGVAQGTLAAGTLEQRQPLPEAVAIALTVGIGEAMAHAHSRGLVHRDLKPENIMLRDNGTPVVIDPGLVVDAANDQRLTATGDIVGTMAYMAPEQRSSAVFVDERADIYALGQILHEMLCLRPRYSRDLLWIQQRSPVIQQRIPKGLRRIIAVATDPDPRWRYPSMVALVADCRRFSSGEPVLGRSRSWWHWPLVCARVYPKLTLSLVTGLIIALLLGVVIESINRLQRAHWRPTVNVMEGFGRGELRADHGFWYRSAEHLVSDGPVLLHTQQHYPSSVEVQVRWEWQSSLPVGETTLGPQLIVAGHADGDGWVVGTVGQHTLVLWRNGVIQWYRHYSDSLTTVELTIRLSDRDLHLWCRGELVAQFAQVIPLQPGFIGVRGAAQGSTYLHRWDFRIPTLPTLIPTEQVVASLLSAAETATSQQARQFLNQAEILLSEIIEGRFADRGRVTSLYQAFLEQLYWAALAEDDEAALELVRQRWLAYLGESESLTSGRWSLALAMDPDRAHIELLAAINQADDDELRALSWQILALFPRHGHGLEEEILPALRARDTITPSFEGLLRSQRQKPGP